MFQVLDFRTIVQGMVAHLRTTQSEITDFYTGSVARTLIEAPAIALDEFYLRVLQGLLEAIPVAVYNAFDFGEIPATAATGRVVFTTPTLVVNAVTIPEGTIVARPDSRQRFITTEDGTIRAGTNSASVRVRAEFAGATGNVPAGVVSLIQSQVTQVNGVSNPNPITGGRDAETAAERKARFVDFIGALSKGTVWAVLYCTRRAVVKDPTTGMTIEYVTRVGLDEQAGHVDIYLYGSGGEPSPALLDAAQRLLNGSVDTTRQTIVPGYRPVGVRVTAQPMNDRLVDFPGKIRLFDGYVYDAALFNALRTAVATQMIGVPPGGVLYVQQLVEAALTVPGVRQVIPDTTENLLCGQHEVLVLGELNLTQVA